KRLSFLIIALIAVFALVACGNDTEKEETPTDNDTDTSTETETSGETYVIGATQIVEHPSLDNAFEGFKAALEDAGLDVEYNYQNAQGDQTNVKTIADNFVADDVDLIFANS